MVNIIFSVDKFDSLISLHVSSKDQLDTVGIEPFSISIFFGIKLDMQRNWTFFNNFFF